MTAAEPVALDALTETQAARRQRVIDAAILLGSAGGYDAVQMRDVAKTAEVALGTIYRYFTSKDHLLASSMVDWSAELERQVARRPPRGDSAADRMVDVIRRATRPMEREPELAAALVTACTANEPSVAALEREITATFSRVLATPLGDLEDPEVAAIVQVLAHVWNSTVLRYVNGNLTVDQIGADLESAARLLLR